jgi:hypothetical protein
MEPFCFERMVKCPGGLGQTKRMCWQSSDGGVGEREAPPVQTSLTALQCFSSREAIWPVMAANVRFPVALRNGKHLLRERGIDIYRETLRLWRSEFSALSNGGIWGNRPCAACGAFAMGPDTSASDL